MLQILMYHRLGTAPEREPGQTSYAIDTTSFDEQMSILAELGTPVVSLADAYNVAAGPPRLPAGAVAITFDDGCLSDRTHALPSLLRHGFSATFFIIPTWIGQPGYLTWKDARELTEAGMTIGAHGLDHTPLDSLDPAALRHQLRESRRIIEHETDATATEMSLPGGAGGERERDAAHDAGFRFVAGSVPRLLELSELGDVVPRFAVRRNLGRERFRALVERRPAALAREQLRYRAVSLARHGLGASLYGQIRARLLRSGA